MIRIKPEKNKTRFARQRYLHEKGEMSDNTLLIKVKRLSKHIEPPKPLPIYILAKKQEQYDRFDESLRFQYTAREYADMRPKRLTQKEIDQIKRQQAEDRHRVTIKL